MTGIYISSESSQRSYEFVERKGSGHPDTLSDNLAEYLSSKYSAYTRDRFGAVLHHNFDKVGLLGGASSVGFGFGRLTKPIRVLLNGRASLSFGELQIPVNELLRGWAAEFLASALPITDPGSELEFHFNLSTQSSPGKTEERTNKDGSARAHWFAPRSLSDIPELKRLFSNDTSMGVGFYPFTTLENLVLAIERCLNGAEFRKENPWVGSDIKIMGFRDGKAHLITMCVPQIGAHVASLEEYKSNVLKARERIERIAAEAGIEALEQSINTRDNYENAELYLTALGSSIESGDEGLVGRGNRIQGFIAPMRPMSMEGVAGKNPIYHIGKVYYVAAQKLSEAIFERFEFPNETVIVSQSGRDLLDPWVMYIHVPESGMGMRDEISAFARDFLAMIPSISDRMIAGDIAIC